MAKKRAFVCHGPHHIMKVQVHAPRGWQQVAILDPAMPGVPRNTEARTVWYCPECTHKRKSYLALEKDAYV